MELSDNQKYDLVIAGGGMAGGRLLRELAQRNWPGRIAWISAESIPGYNRVLLPELLAGSCGRDELLETPAGLDLTLFSNRTLVSFDADRCEATLDTGPMLKYQILVLATGASPRRPDLPGATLAGVGALRTLQDVERLSGLNPRDSVVVVGGGLLGLEAAAALNAREISVTVLHRHAQLLNRNLDQRGAEILLDVLQKRGVRVLCDCQPIEISQIETGLSVATDTGGAINATEVLFAVGTEPRSTYHSNTKGVPVNLSLKTSEAGVYAMGECALVDGIRYGQVDAVFAQARTIADQLCGSPGLFVPPAQVTRLKVPGFDLLSLGDFSKQTQEDSRLVCVEDRSRGVYRALRLVENQLSSAVLLGDVQGSTAIQQRLDTALSDEDRELLLFGLEAA